MTYHAKSMTHKVREFFAANPDAELSVAGIAQRFDISKEQAQSVVWQLKRQGFVESAHVIRAVRPKAEA